MSVPLHIQSYLDSKVSMFQIVDEVLDAWSGEGCLQFPTLIGQVNAKMNWIGKEGEKLSRANEPIIRDYVRNHPNWHVTRGAHGGIMRASEKQKKEEAKAAKDKAKAELAAAIEAEVVRKKAEAAVTQTIAEHAIVTDITNSDSE
jgi:hypothetical protein